ncbi:MAG: type I DNA topoisomerase [bacterium]|nr:type I DNA topoisomerase [bacterium]
MNLVIVESPAKSKTISKFLGPDYRVLASFGHVRDLPKSKLGVDVEHNFEPHYLIPAKAKKVVAELKTAAADSEVIILATDEDREGEAIGWHLVQALKLENSKKHSIQRIAFHEITKSAITEALKHPRQLDMNLVDAQQARRVLDRLVGYELSPFLWKKIRYGLSAGRVQSVALRLVVEREREIQSFVKEEYWSIEAELSDKEKNAFRARLIKIGEKALEKLDLKNENGAKKIVDDLAGSAYRVKEVVKKEASRHPAPPFTTSTLQQESSRKLGMSAKQTMLLAQQLYEHGYITYMRTDSHNLAQSALDQAKQVIAEHFGKNYTVPEARHYSNKSKGAQEAHEAIRPTDLSARPEILKSQLDPKQFKIYDLIWKRTLASQMASAMFDQTTVDISAGDKYTFRANGQVLKFDGFIKVYTEGRDEQDEEASDSRGLSDRLPELSVDEILNLIKLLPLQHFTEPPPRYTDATLIKALEIHGVGRPSTYAPTLSTIQDRKYVEKIEKKYHPVEIGFLVNDMLVENFPEIVDIDFTSHIEEGLDDVAEGKVKWVPLIEEFYTPFKKHLIEKEATVEKLVEQTDIPCPTCGKKMIIKFGRAGKFLACPDLECKTTKPLPEEEAKIKELDEKTKDERCPLCGKDMTVRRGRFGYFLGCSDYPKCKGISKIWNKTGFKCPACQKGEIVEKKSRGRGKVFYACTNFPDCTFLMSKKPESEEELEKALKDWQEKPPKSAKLKKTKTGETPVE